LLAHYPIKHVIIYTVSKFNKQTNYTKDKFLEETKMYAPETQKKVEDRLLATHVSNNSNFEAACLSGDGLQIMDIVKAEMEKNKLFTKGSKKLQADILRMLQGRSKVSPAIGQQVLMFVWNSRMSGIGLAVN
jgi:hypothetical protein